MRLLETVLLLANGLTFFGLAIRRVRASRVLRFVAPIAVLVAGAQILIEGPRWQMMPAYALTGLLFVAWLLQEHPRGAHARTRGHAERLAGRVATAVGLIGLAASTALPMLIPIFRFPTPTGPYAIGTLTYHWIDAGRPEVFTADPDDRRELMVQVWYPAVAEPSAARAPYVQHPEVLAPLARLFGLPAFTFGYLNYVTTNAVTSAPAAHGGPYPVLIFSHGRGGYRQHNTMQVEELVSHGYIVAAIDHPYAATGVVFPDGRIAAFDPRMFDPSHPSHPEFLDRIIPFLAEDALFTLDRLAGLNQSDPNGILAGQLDLQRAGMFGVSLGGEITAEACHLTPRLSACLAMDVFMPADVVETGLRQPTMWISRDARSMQLEHWSRRDIDETQTTMRAVFDKLPADGYLVLIPGTFHPNFSDFPLLSPLTHWLGLTGPIDGRRASRIIDAFSLAFFDRHLKSRADAFLDRPEQRFPEVLYKTRRSRHG